MNENLQAVVTAVNTILKDTNLHTMTNYVVERLVSFGYSPTADDSWMIAFSMQKTAHHVLNQINHQTIPEGLFETVVDMMCGEILNVKLQSGDLDETSIDISSGSVESVKIGDTTVTYNTDGGGDTNLNSFLEWLMDGKGCDLLCYRKMRW